MEYETALVCLNGHVINDKFVCDPTKNEKFCTQCGEPTIASCPQCKTQIRGCSWAVKRLQITTAPTVEDVQHWNETYELGKYCHECGKPYPWTQRNIEAAQKMLEKSGDVSDTQKGGLIESVPDLTIQTPRTVLAVSRFKNFLGDLSTNPTVLAVWTNILCNLATEPVKKLLGIG